MTAGQLGLAALLATLVASAFALLLRERRDLGAALAAQPMGWTAAVCAFFAIAASRFALAQPTFLHANLHGAALVDDIFGFPQEAWHRASYGQFSFFLLGALAALFGRCFETVVISNQLFGLGALAISALLAWHWTRQAAVGFAVLALGGLHPVLLRVAASEDAHGLGLLLGWIALAAFEGYAASRHRAALVCGTAALLLLAHTRQTYYLWILGVFAVALSRERRLIGDAGFRLAALAVAAVLVFRITAAIEEHSEQHTLVVIPLVLTSPRMLLATLRHHPLLDVARFGPLLLLGVASGLPYALAQRGPARTLAWLAIAYFVATLGFGWPASGVELSFRAPVSSLAVMLGGIGSGAIAARLLASLRAGPARALGTALAFVTCAAPTAFPAWRTVRASSTDFAEYLALRAALPMLPRRVALLSVHDADESPPYSPPWQLLRSAGIEARVVHPGDLARVEPGETVIFASGVQCWGYALGESVHVGPDALRALSVDGMSRILLPLLDHADDLRAYHVPRTMRPACAALAARGTPLGPPIEIPVEQDVPFVVYGRDPMPLVIYRIDR